MRIGIYVSGRADLDTVLGRFDAAERRGFRTAWTGQLLGVDGLTLLALAALRTERIELGSWVVPTPPRHPSALAQQALTVHAAARGRLVLGIGCGHASLVRDRLGLDASRPLQHMREYLAVLRPLLAGEELRHAGEVFRVSLRIAAPELAPPPVLLGALGPRMLDLAGAGADGAAIWMGGPRFLEDFAIPRLRRAAREAGRPPPRIACGLAVALTGDAARGRAAAEAFLNPGARLPAYRRALEREGVASPGQLAWVGDEPELERRLAALEAIGVTDLCAVPLPVEGDPDAETRTLDFLATRA